MLRNPKSFSDKSKNFVAKSKTSIPSNNDNNDEEEDDNDNNEEEEDDNDNNEQEEEDNNNDEQEEEEERDNKDMEDEGEDNDNDDNKEEEDDNNNLSTNFFGFVNEIFGFVLKTMTNPNPTQVNVNKCKWAKLTTIPDYRDKLHLGIFLITHLGPCPCQWDQTVEIPDHHRDSVRNSCDVLDISLKVLHVFSMLSCVSVELHTMAASSPAGGVRCCCRRRCQSVL